MSSKGVFLFAKNNGQLDYVKQAVFLARRIKKYLKVPVSLATDSPSFLEQTYGTDDFDKIIKLDYTEEGNMRYFYDGAMSKKSAGFKNANRASAYELSPYDETLLLDTDYIISNNLLKSVFKSKSDFLIYKKSSDVSQARNEEEFQKIDDTSVDFYWATVVFFRKTKTNKIFFDLVKHIEHEWHHYRRTYQIKSHLFRNDFAFSIAIHIMNGFAQGSFADELPGTMFYTADKDILWQMENDEMMFLIEKENYTGEYTSIRTKGLTIHVMNKFSLTRMIDKELENG